MIDTGEAATVHIKMALFLMESRRERVERERY